MELAAKALRLGSLVAFPAETVYGLGADAENPLAIARMFDVKNRVATTGPTSIAQMEYIHSVKADGSSFYLASHHGLHKWSA